MLDARLSVAVVRTPGMVGFLAKSSTVLGLNGEQNSKTEYKQRITTLKLRYFLYSIPRPLIEKSVWILFSDI